MELFQRDELPTVLQKIGFSSSLSVYSLSQRQERLELDNFILNPLFFKIGF